jgi:serine/threonine-protein kinase RsbW
VVEGTLDSSTVHLELDGEAESVALVRAMLAGVAELLDFDGELLDGLNTTVSEACNNVVKHAYAGDPGPMIVRLEADEQCVEVTIRDRGIGLEETHAPEDHVGVGHALISALADRSEVFTHPDGGAEVRIGFHRHDRAAGADEWRESPNGAGLAPLVTPGVVGTLAPVNLLGGVLGRMGRLLAARAQFSLERFSDLYLLFDQLGFHAARRARTPRITFSLSTESRRLQVAVGPLDAAIDGSTPREWHEPPANLGVLADELTVEPVDGALLLRLVVDGTEARSGA